VTDNGKVYKKKEKVNVVLAIDIEHDDGTE
jgi:hypothetical protein